MKLAQNVFPQGDKIAVLLSKAEEVTKSGIIIPESAAKKEKPQQGVIIAISEYLSVLWGKDFDERSYNEGGFTPPERKVRGLAEGDTILFAQYAGDDIKIKDLETDEDRDIKILSVESVLSLLLPSEEA
jgi:chaperonin GroES